MPRSAATMLGLILVAASIGFNTVRYPVVWQMLSPANAAQPSPPKTSPPEEPESPAAPAHQPAPPSPPAVPMAIRHEPEVAEKVAVGNPAPAETKTATGINATVVEARKPLVPVPPLGLHNAPGNEAAGVAGIRRLPPLLTQTEPIVAARNPSESIDGSIPMYPSTGIE